MLSQKLVLLDYHRFYDKRRVDGQDNTTCTFTVRPSLLTTRRHFCSQVRHDAENSSLSVTGTTDIAVLRSACRNVAYAHSSATSYNCRVASDHCRATIYQVFLLNYMIFVNIWRQIMTTENQRNNTTTTSTNVGHRLWNCVFGLVFTRLIHIALLAYCY